MTQADQDATLGRVTREWKELHGQVVHLESELKAVGEALAKLGEQLQASPPIINVEMPTVVKDRSDWEHGSDLHLCLAERFTTFRSCP